MRFVAPALAASAAVLAFAASMSSSVSARESTMLTPVQTHTVAVSRCGTAALSTSDANCLGFDARQVRESPDMAVLGFENDQELGEKHILQVVVVFDLSQLPLEPNARVRHANLGYSESSTVRRSPSGESQYGILPTCNTRLGVPTSDWNGNTNALVVTRPALTASAAPATTGDSGSWDVTPQVQEWLAAGQQKGTLVMQGDDESADIQGQSMCLSYVFDLGLDVEAAPDG